MISYTTKGDWKKTYKFLEKVTDIVGYSILDKYGQMGVDALASATPKDSGVTADSWSYSITKEGEDITITWSNNSKTDTGIPIVILLQYGHGTRNGGYVQGRDFINPAIKPVFDRIAEAVWKEVRNS